MKAIAIIPARGGSKRIPQKNFQEIDELQGGNLTEAQLRQHHQSAWQSLRDGDLDGAWRKSRVLNTE